MRPDGGAENDKVTNIHMKQEISYSGPIPKRV
jgi:hypothetical protein